MRVVFCGVGEAFDETLPNTSVLTESNVTGGGALRALLDCGFTAAHAYWRAALALGGFDPADLDMAWVSHFHGDHAFGLPALLLRFWDAGREKPFTVCGGPEVRERCEALMDMAYPGLRERFGFPLRYAAFRPGERRELSLDAGTLTLATALQDHPEPCLAVTLDDGAARLFYSGDGRPTDATLALARGADLVVHEAFNLEADTPGHGSVAGAIVFAQQAGAGGLACVHLRREVRHERRAQVQGLLAAAQDKGLEAFLPEPGDWLEL